IDELRQERREKRNRLRVRQRNGKAAPDMHVQARQVGGATLPGMAPRLDAEQNQIGRPAPAQNLAQRDGGSDHPPHTQTSGGEQDRVAERGADDGGERGARALARASRDDQRHDRARGNDQDGGYYEESGEQFPIHDASMLRSRSASSSAKADDPAMTVKNW